jgi:N-acetylmuramoyl-L-alanine amidase
LTSQKYLFISKFITSNLRIRIIRVIPVLLVVFFPGSISSAILFASRPKLDVIVLDAGHGGKDSGAIGTNGYMEKQATLAIILKLGKLIEKEMPGVKVVYTRHDDHFVELYRRGEIANESHGKLFISVHCNSTPQKPSNATGFTTYFLRPGKTEAAIHVAARENAVIKYETGHHKYADLSDVDYILTSMSRNQDVKFSEKFASLVQQELGKKLRIPDNGVSQAGFLVLIGASMPNVLIETGFISDPKDESLLKSDAGESNYARGILEAIKKYKAIYERS